MSPKPSEQLTACQLLPVNDSVDLSFAVKMDEHAFGAELLSFSPACFSDCVAEAPLGLLGGLIFNDRQRIVLAA
jgi:hypothetical protein